MTDTEASGFAQRYGPWALVVGASEGIGAAFARAVAEQGLDVVLVARRQAALDEVASGIRAGTGVQTRTVSVDLTAADAVSSITEATAGLEVGLVLYCAGGDPNYEPFLSQPVENAVALVERNCVAPLRICHHFAAPMQARGRGGIVLVSSGAGLVGGRNMVAYGATKAFDMVMAEALWAELHGSGVDVLGVVLGVTDTPALRRTLARRGQLADPDAPIPGAATAEDVVAETLANLSNGPTCFATEDVREGAKHLGALSRNDAAQLMLELGGGVMGPDVGGAVVTGTVDHEVRQHVADVLVRYATGIDRRDWALFRSCFTDDCEVDYGEIGVWRSAEEITEWMREVHEPCGHTMHRITNRVVTPSDGGVAARSYVDGIVMFADNQAGTRATGYYDDELVVTDDGWKIARRRFTLVLLQLFPEGTSLELGA